ncbi:DUF429 domain-containing protein [Microbacterium sp. P06]|uniref:DUF429 domain-containing protein n=1 Tax=unclassified Microbacterium TaxID=2609290 RepID=UPI003746ED18
MRTVGVDLAAESTKTAVAVIEWGGADAALTRLSVGVADAEIVDASRGADKVGIDCAFGWPDEFVAFVVAQADSAAATFDGGMEWRRTLAYRETDRFARHVTGRWPLSVSTDRLGLTAMRCSGLLGRLRDAGHDVDRSGSGDVAEVYPGASLRLWGFDTTGYRSDAETRTRLLAGVVAGAPWLHLGGHAELMARSGDAFDAVVAALAARSAALGRYTPPAPELLDRARREGWIALPSGALADLVASRA